MTRCLDSPSLPTASRSPSERRTIQSTCSTCRPRSLVIGDTSTLIRDFEKQDGPVFTVAFDPKGQEIAVGGGSGEIRLYNTDTGDRLASLKGFEGGVYSVVFSPSGEQLAAAGF